MTATTKSFDATVGRYTTTDLERMSVAELSALSSWAIDRLESVIEGYENDESIGPMSTSAADDFERATAYFEQLSDAADAARRERQSLEWEAYALLESLVRQRGLTPLEAAARMSRVGVSDALVESAKAEHVRLFGCVNAARARKSCPGKLYLAAVDGRSRAAGRRARRAARRAGGEAVKRRSG